VIERHRELSVLCDEAVSISAKLEDGPEFDAADEISAGRSDALVEHAAVLIRSEPTTMTGTTALIRYVASLGEWQVPTDEDWHQVFLGTLANARQKAVGKNGRRASCRRPSLALPRAGGASEAALRSIE
jgi:hypothetical protein